MLESVVGALSIPPAPFDPWRAVVGRHRDADGRFVYAVRTTGVYCRPSCASRRPLRRNVSFFATPGEAEAAGFRACRRCKPTESARPELADRLERARRLLDASVDERLTLRDLGAKVGVSPFHLQREFLARFGVSPSAYQRARRTDHFKRALERGDTVTTATYDAGFGSSRAAYEHGTRTLGMTPSAFRRGGEGESIGFVTAACRYGRVLVAATARGLCAVQLGDDDASLEGGLRTQYPAARVARVPRSALPYLADVLDTIEGNARAAVPMDVHGSAFQWKVWRALQAIPAGETRSYGEVARSIGRPTASRAVARACASNRLALLVPCHRAVRADGGIGGYRWGVTRKRRILARERGGQVLR
ncbi:MAG: bifunctional DNA-binding transcriptional regulator/O6-methylguanine-DNA methyltransferase Ada [Vicinamibacterales bacterium]